MYSLMCFGKYYHIKLVKHLKSTWQDIRVNINIIRQLELSTIREKLIPLGVIRGQKILTGKVVGSEETLRQKLHIKKQYLGAGEMPQWLRALVALSEDPSLAHH